MQGRPCSEGAAQSVRLLACRQQRERFHLTQPTTSSCRVPGCLQMARLGLKKWPYRKRETFLGMLNTLEVRAPSWCGCPTARHGSMPATMLPRTTACSVPPCPAGPHGAVRPRLLRPEAGRRAAGPCAPRQRRGPDQPHRWAVLLRPRLAGWGVELRASAPPQARSAVLRRSTPRALTSPLLIPLPRPQTRAP